MTRLSEAIVAGSGPAALAAAIALARADVSVTLLSRASIRGTPTYGEHLAPIAKSHLSLLGLDRPLTDTRHLPSHGIASAWGDPVPYTSDYIFNPYGCGWNLDRVCFDQALLDEAVAGGAEMVVIDHLDAVDAAGDSWHITVSTLEGRRRLACRFLVDATGRNASRHRFGPMFAAETATRRVHHSS